MFTVPAAMATQFDMVPANLYALHTKQNAEGNEKPAGFLRLRGDA
jgi:hypothetical protein